MSSSVQRRKCVQDAAQLKVGDIIQAFHAGYHRITKIEKRFIKQDESYWDDYPNCIGEEYSPLIHYERVLSSKFSPSPKGKKNNCCDALYCRVITHQIVDDMMVEAVAGISRLKALL